MNQPVGFSDKVGFIWGVADLLRGDFKAHEYGQVVLPLVVLRRLECALAETKSIVVAKAEQLGDSPGKDAVLRAVAKHRFWNASPLDLTKILADPGTAAANLRTYLAGFSPSAREVLDAYGFRTRSLGWTRPGCSTRCWPASPTSTCPSRRCPTRRWATSSRSCCGGSRR
jgi:type I restriction enzyme M protein